LLFPGTVSTVDTAAMMMYLGAIAVIFYSLSTLSNGLLQGINRLRIPVTNAAIALVAHAIFLVALMMFFRLNIYAVVFANVFFALLMCFLNQMALRKYSGYRQEWLKSFVIPFIASAIMGVFAFFIYRLLYMVSHINSLSTIISIVIAAMIYFVALLLFKGVDETDLSRFPKGTLLVKLAKKLHLLPR